MSNDTEKFPFSRDRDGNLNVKVIKYKEIYRNNKFWKVAFLVETYGKIQVQIYMWMFDERKRRWVEKQKYSEMKEQSWNEIKTVVDEWIKEIPTLQAKVLKPN